MIAIALYRFIQDASYIFLLQDHHEEMFPLRPYAISQDKMLKLKILVRLWKLV